MRTSANAGQTFVRNIKEAASFGGCGFEVGLHKGIDFQSEDRYDNWFVAERSFENPALDSQSLYRAMANKELPAEHPLCVGALAIDNRRELLAWIDGGGSVMLRSEGLGLWRVARSTRGTDVQTQPEKFRTTDILIAAALATVGCDPLSAEPAAFGSPINRILFNAYSRQDAADSRLSAVKLACDFRDGSMAREPVTSQFLRCMMALNCFQRLVEYQNKATPILFITGQHGRHAYIRADASGDQHDKVRQFFSV